MRDTKSEYKEDERLIFYFMSAISLQIISHNQRV
jgi:hypothetical protein